MQEDGVEHAEDDDVSADAEGEGDQRGRGECWGALQLAQGVADVAAEAVEGEGGVGVLGHGWNDALTSWDGRTLALAF